jgi:hypothetical protein
MNTRQLVLKLCEKERGKKQVNVAQMSEIVGKLADILYAEAMSGRCHRNQTVPVLLRLGSRRNTQRLLDRP